MKTLSNVEKLEVLPYHTLGENKYEKMGIEYPLKGVPQLSKEEAVRAENIIRKSWGKELLKTEEKYLIHSLLNFQMNLLILLKIEWRIEL